MFGHLGCSFLCSLWPEKIEGVTDRTTPVTYLYRRAYSRLHVGKLKAAQADCCYARYGLRAMNNDIWTAGLPSAQLCTAGVKHTVFMMEVIEKIT